MKTLTLPISISEHHKLTRTMLKSTFAKELLFVRNFDLFHTTFKSTPDKFYNSQPLMTKSF